MSDELSKERLDLVYEVVEVAKATGKIKKGTNEATKAIEKGTAKIVAFAKDVTPPEVVMHIPLLCKDKGIPCYAIPSREELGTAAGLIVPTAAVAVVDEGNGKKVLQELLKGEKAPEAEKPAEEAKEEPKEEKKEEAKPEAKPEEKAEEKAEEKPEEKKEEAPAEEKPEEKPAEEKPTEEAKEEPKEEKKEEAPAEEKAEEAKPEEKKE